MLREPYTCYDQLHVYSLDNHPLPVFDDPDLIGVWMEDGCPILFFHRPKDDLVADLCRKTGARLVYQADLNYRDWEAGVEITSFATRWLTVRPVWEQSPVIKGDSREIVLDPSVIFGSGFHATTRLCLETLESLLLESGDRIRSVLDLGTGTGLLAIAAARLGVERVAAVDNNPFAVNVARRNVSLNDCAQQIDVFSHDIRSGLPAMDYDLVISNLYKGLLLQLFENPDFWQPRYHLVSGFIPGMEPDLLAALPIETVQMIRRTDREQWRLWLLRKKER